MSFISYKTKDKDGKALPKSKWIFDQYYSDNMDGGKARERDYAKVLEQAGCKIVWNKVK
jgi:hypothetical protein